MPLWSVEEWRARIGSSWAALGRPVGCSSRKERRHYVCCLAAPGGGGGGMVMSLDRTIPMMTIVTLLMLTMSLSILLPLDTGCSPIPHSAALPIYSEWQTTVPISHIIIVETMELDQKIDSVHASLLLRCGDIEVNPGPLGRQDLDKVDNSYVLTENDVREAYHELMTIKANYYQLGIELGLPPGELEAIRQAHSQNIAQALTQVLLTWLRQLYDVEQHGRPTWQRLVEAVGGINHALAMGIASKHDRDSHQSTRIPSNTQPLPYYAYGQIPSFPCWTGGSQFTHPGTPYQPPWLYAQPGPMQQVHSTSSFQGGSQFIHHGTPYHQPPWSHVQPRPMQQGHSTNSFQGGPFQVNFSQFGFHQRTIPPLHQSSWTPHPGQEQDGESEVTLSSKRHKLDPSQHPLGQVPSSICTTQHLDHWRQKLIDSYLAQECSSDAWPPLKMVHFVQLALVKQDEQARHIGLETIRKDIDEVYGNKSKIDFRVMFEKIDPASLILLEGRPGSGKTTLMVKVSCDWARGIILHSKLVILVRLRYLKKTGNIYLHDLLGVACSAFSSADIDGLSSYIEGRLGEDVVFVLDGFDEYTPGVSDDNYISKLILKQVYSRSIVIVSSRPAATQRFRQNTTKWIEVIGFFKDQVVQYVTSYFENRREKEREQQLIQHLEQHPNLMNLCYLPLHCAMLVFMYELEDVTLPETETEFYRDFTLSILIRSIRKQSERTNRLHMLKSFDCLPHNERTIFDRVCKLAYEATIASQQVFEKDELNFNDSLDDAEGSLGLVVIDRYFVKHGLDETYTFLHLTFQEYLSAVYIAGLSQSEQTNIVSTRCSEKHLYITWCFLFGILDYSKESTVNLFKLILDNTRGDLLLHIQCAYESHHKSACTDVLLFHENNLEFEYIRLSASDLTCITYVLKTADYTTIKLYFSECDFSVDEAVALLKGVGDRRLSLTMDEGPAVQSVLDALSLVTVPGLIELNLSGGSGESVSMKSNLKHSTNLQTLRLSNIDITNCGLEEGFKHWPNLKELYLFISIDDTSCPLTVLEAIKHCTSLVWFSILGYRLCVSEVQVLGESLKFISKLHTIFLGYNPFGDDGLQALSEGIKNCKELQQLCLWNNNLTDESIRYLTEVIKSTRNLQTLDLTGNQFTPKGKELLEEAVRERNSVGGMTELNLML